MFKKHLIIGIIIATGTWFSASHGANEFSVVEACSNISTVWDSRKSGENSEFEIYETILIGTNIADCIKSKNDERAGENVEIFYKKCGEYNQLRAELISDEKVAPHLENFENNHCSKSNASLNCQDCIANKGTCVLCYEHGKPKTSTPSIPGPATVPENIIQKEK